MSSAQWKETMKLVVIGGAGLVGSKLVPKLRGHGHEAIAALRRAVRGGNRAYTRQSVLSSEERLRKR